MRHPNTGLSEDDLSRLTGSSSSTASGKSDACNSSSSSSSSSSSATESASSSSSSSTKTPDAQQHQTQTTSSDAKTCNNDNQLTATAAAAAAAAAVGTAPTKNILDAELLKNLKNTSTHSLTTTHTHAHENGNGTSTTNATNNTIAITNNTNSTNTNISNTNNGSSHFNSSYLPEFIDPLDWQKSRKRKERPDSTSSTTQDRKLVRSNSEELLTNEEEYQRQRQQQQQQTQQQHKVTADETCCRETVAGAPAALRLRRQDDAIRRVASEDFKKMPYCFSDGAHSESGEAVSHESPALMLNVTANSLINNNNNNNGVDENDAAAANRQHHQQPQQQCEPLHSVHSEALFSGPTKDMTRRSRTETSPARSQRNSPHRHGGATVSGTGANNSSKYHRDSDDSECEHERRRSSERFCKSRAPPGRKAVGIIKKPGGGKCVQHKLRGDENAYKYDLSTLKYERRGFVSKSPSIAAAVSTAAEKSIGADYNDNNLIDFQIVQNEKEQQKSLSSITEIDLSHQSSPRKVDNKSLTTTTLTTNTNASTTSAEALPWDSSSSSSSSGGSSSSTAAADQSDEPMLSRRYATVRHRPPDSIDTAAKLLKVMPYPQHFHKQTPITQRMLADDYLEPLETYRAFTSLENLKTREVMQQVIPAMMSYQTSDERLRQLNKRLAALKKKLVQFDEHFEARTGYRPSQAEKQNDKYMKHVLAELNKLRKEKQQLKSELIVGYGCGSGGGAVGLKSCGGRDMVKKLEKIKISLSDIEQNLTDKREDANRSEVLEELSAEQLLQEKSAVQHGLLYFESLYGRPSTKEERDAARPLYDRYRQLKRLVSRSVAMSGCATATELPTIHEHEAMVFESTPQPWPSPSPQYASNNSSDSGSSSHNDLMDSSISSTNTGITINTTDHVDASGANTTANTTRTNNGENISALSIEQLWTQLDKTREEKKLLKHAIREFEMVFEQQNGRKMLRCDRKAIEQTYAQYKEKKAKTRLLQALIKKHISR